MHEYALFCNCIPYESITFRIIKEGNGTCPYRIISFCVVALGHADFDILCFDFFFLGGVGWGGGDIAMLIDIGDHIIQA